MRDFLFLKDNGKSIRIFYHDLQYVEAFGKYVRFVTTEKSYMVSGRLQNVPQRLPEDQFCRIHKSFIVSFRHISEFTSDKVAIAGTEIPIGKQYRNTFFQQAEVLDPASSNGKLVANKMGKLLKIVR